MKKILFIVIIVLTLSSLSFPLAYAAATPTPTVNPDILQKLTAEIASQTAKLNLVKRIGVIGTVTGVSDTEITISDLAGATRFIDIDELTKFSPLDSSSDNSKTFGISDIKKNDTIGVLGIFNKESQRIRARFVDELQLPQSVHGTIVTTDATNFEAPVVTGNGQTTLNFDSSTKTYSFTKDGGYVKSGFSKIKAGQHVIAQGNPNSKDKNLFDVTRVIIFPEIVEANVVTPTESPSSK